LLAPPTVFPLYRQMWVVPPPERRWLDTKKTVKLFQRRHRRAIGGGMMLPIIESGPADDGCPPNSTGPGRLPPLPRWRPSFERSNANCWEQDHDGKTGPT